MRSASHRRRSRAAMWLAQVFSCSEGYGHGCTTTALLTPLAPTQLVHLQGRNPVRPLLCWGSISLGHRKSPRSQRIQLGIKAAEFCGAKAALAHPIASPTPLSPFQLGTRGDGRHSSLWAPVLKQPQSSGPGQREQHRNSRLFPGLSQHSKT